MDATKKLFCGCLALAMALAGGAAAHAAARVRVPVDLGKLQDQAQRTPISVTIALALPRIADAEALLTSINTAGSEQYHHFLSAGEFVARFAPARERIDAAIAGLSRFGLAVEQTGATRLRVTGLPADIERAFSVDLHVYEVAAQGDAPGYTYRAPLSRGTVPAELAGMVAGVAGLDSRPTMHPQHLAAPSNLVHRPVSQAPQVTGNAPGLLTVADFARLYDLLPMYALGVHGRGMTVGVMTFASFTPSDAFAYWSAVGLSVSQNRIRIVDVDGGSGAPSDSGGSLETTLDVEQSGGVAPQANIIVYEAPNSSQGLVDLVAQAIDDNEADSLSISWGEWEWLDVLGNSPVTDPSTGNTVGVTQAVHELLVRAGIQGQSVYTAAGDSGAYEVNGDLGCYGPYSATVAKSCSLVISVEYPASDPAITAGGGTTLPGKQEYCLNTACTRTYSIDIANQQAWGWDYLDGLCTAEGTPNPIACGTYSTGGGGGVSIEFAVPSYQASLAGVQASQNLQVFQDGTYYVDNDGIPSSYTLPSAYAGRNVPDISLNADPQTGYSVYYTSSAPGSTLGITTYEGGTSFVAPQLNGIAALLGQFLNVSRVGLLNASFYSAAQQVQKPSGSEISVQPIAYGDNWFYSGSDGYNPAAGLGTLDVMRFARYLRATF
jgi:kumamolisin